MEAARIPWRPLGRILVEQGLLTSEELETALEQQERTGKRLGETIVECGFVSGPELSNALASQYGIELTTETGFGTGLRGQIQRRHESERKSVRPVLVEVDPIDDDSDPLTEPELEEPDAAPPEGSLLTQLEEQWAKFAAAEALLIEQEQELATLAAQRDRRREQAARLARRARGRSAAPETETHQLQHLHELAEQLRAEVQRLTADVRSRDEELGRVEQENTQGHERLAGLEGSLQERERQVGELSNQLEHAAAEARGREEELERLRHELGQAHNALTTAETVIGGQDRRVEGLEADFERLVHSRTEVETALAAAQESLGERDRNLDTLNHELGRRRAQAGRFVDRLRRLREHASDEPGNGTADSQAALDAAEAMRSDLERQLGELRGEAARLRHETAEGKEALSTAEAAIAERDRQLAELRAASEFLEIELRGRSDQLERLAHETAGSHEALAASGTALTERDGELAKLRSELEQLAADLRNRDGETERLACESAEHGRERDRRRAQALRFARRLQEVRRVEETHHVLIERLAADVRGCDEEIARNRGELAERARELEALRAKHTRARAQAQRFVERLRRRERTASPSAREEHEAPASQIASHLVFVQLADRYELVERVGPPPPRASSLELPELDGLLVVAGSRRSPLPGDARPCVVAEPAAVSQPA